MSNAAAVEALFFAALELEKETERAAFLDSACGVDVELRQQVKKLLNAHPRVGDFLARPVVERLAAAQERTGATQQRGDSAEAEDDGLAFLQPSTRSDSLGRIGHYEILQVLGRGGFGIVFRAFDDVLQRTVALKVLAAQMAATSPARKRFLREARASAQVRHENVVHVYEVCEQPLPYLVMEFIPGETLQQRLDRTGPLETVEVVRIGRQIALGLAAAHEVGLIHRDVKPANVLLEAGPNQHVKITDFGLARAADDASASQSGLVAGTPMFMAPEQANGEALDHRADLFSLGSVLYSMTSGRPPFRAKSTLAVLKRVVEDTARPIPEIIPEVPTWLCDLIARLHAKKPEDRFASAQEVADLLAQRLEQLQRPGNAEALQVAAPVVEKTPPTLPAPRAAPAIRSRFNTGRLAVAAATLLALMGSLGVTEATGVTDLQGTVIRLRSPDGTLVVEVDDPDVSVTVDGADLVIKGAGVKEIRLKPGNYKVEASKDGKVVSQELVTVTKKGRQIVRISKLPPPPPKPSRSDDDAAAWERTVAKVPAAEQAKAVGARLKELNPGSRFKQINPGFDGKVAHVVERDVVTKLSFSTDHVSDVSPVRALPGLKSLACRSGRNREGKLTDLLPLKGLPLTHLDVYGNPVCDLSPLEGMKLTQFSCRLTHVRDLSPLKGMPLETFSCGFTRVSDLTPLKGMKLLIMPDCGAK